MALTTTMEIVRTPLDYSRLGRNTPENYPQLFAKERWQLAQTQATDASAGKLIVKVQCQPKQDNIGLYFIITSFFHETTDTTTGDYSTIVLDGDEWSMLQGLGTGSTLVVYNQPRVTMANGSFSPTKFIEQPIHCGVPIKGTLGEIQLNFDTNTDAKNHRFRIAGFNYYLPPITPRIPIW